MNEVKRVFKFGSTAEVRLGLLMDRLGVNDAAEVLRRAMRLYEWAVEEVEEGKRIGAVDREGRVEFIDIHAHG